MPAFTYKEKTDMVFNECHGNQRDAARMYSHRFPVRRPPAAATIWLANRNLCQYGCLRKPTSASAETQLRRENRAHAVLGCMYINPHASTRDIAEQVGVSQRSVVRILHKFTFHPYRIHLHQELHANDWMRHVVFCVSIRDLIASQQSFLENIVFSDEATIHRNRYNLHYWAQENPFWLREETHQIQWKVNVWCAILGDRLLDPYFIDGRQTAHEYLTSLQGAVTDDVLDNLPLNSQR